MIAEKQLNFMTEEKQKIINGDCLFEMRNMEPESISCIVTDPPYGLKFMGKDWDHGIPGVEFWKEALRISKPGTWLLAFGGTRTHHRLTCAIEDAGWEIRDCIMWLYGSGFPKGKGCLKPAYEPIIMARKGGCKVSENFLNIDECRVGSSKPECKNTPFESWRKLENRDDRQNPDQTYDSSVGRWPANIILDEESAELLDKQSGVTKSCGGRSGHTKAFSGGFKQEHYGDIKPGFGDSGGASRFFYCPKASSKERNEGLDGMPLKDCGMMEDDNYPIKTGSGNLRDTRRQNFHPCVKPIKLMEYLIKLVMPKYLFGDFPPVLLDPFAGSGTTILAAKRLGVEAIGIELNEEYCEIARKRIL